MSTPAKRSSNDDTRLGEYSALQPLSGIASVNETGAVNGLGRGGFVRKEEAETGRTRKAR